MDAKVVTSQTDVLLLPVAALDVGYFSVKGASGRDEAESLIQTFAFPSQCAKSQGHSSVSIGMNAHSGINVRVGQTLYFVGQDAALNSHARQTRTITESFVDSDEYKALFLGGLHYIVKEHVARLKSQKVHIRRLVAGLPMNTFDKYKDLVRSKMEGKHLVPGITSDAEIEVTIQSVAVIPQPQGAMVSIGASRSTAELNDFFAQNILVLDIGGGTFDWFLTNEKKAIRARSDGLQKGMLTCVNLICDSIKKGIKDDPIVIKRIDDALRNNKETVLIGGTKYDMRGFDKYIVPVMDECLNAMHNNVLSLDSVDLIIFTGGGARFLHQAAIKRWPEFEKNMLVDTNPVFSNVRGFYILGEVINGQSQR